MLRKILLVGACVAGLTIPSVANAASYLFDVEYSGFGNASLIAGSDNPLSSVLASGDTVVYNLKAAGSGQWTTLGAGSIFPFFALAGNFGSSNVTFTLNLNQNGSSIFSFGATENNCCAHLGTNTVAFGNGLVFDEYSLAMTVNSVAGPGAISSILPWPGQGPEQHQPDLISFDPGAVPEPATWMMMLIGFGVVGAAMRRQRVTARINFA